LESIALLLAGFFIGTFGTLIGAGGGFILVPLLLIFYPDLEPEVTTAISIAVVAVNALSGSVAYARSGRIDYRAGIVFALYTIPGSILGVLTVQYIPQHSFNTIIGMLLVLLASYLVYKNATHKACINQIVLKKGFQEHILTDSAGTTYHYSYNPVNGNIVSLLVGYISPLLGIGGGIIHVPAMVNWLKFPVHIATATSHFILAVMATASVVTHACKGTYNDPHVLHMILFIALGVIPGAQLGAFLSHKIKSNIILQVLAICLAIVGMRILITSL